MFATISVYATIYIILQSRVMVQDSNSSIAPLSPSGHDRKALQRIGRYMIFVSSALIARMTTQADLLPQYPLIYTVCTLPLAAGRMAAMGGVKISLAYFCLAGASITCKPTTPYQLVFLTPHYQHAVGSMSSCTHSPGGHSSSARRPRPPTISDSTPSEPSTRPTACSPPSKAASNSGATNGAEPPPLDVKTTSSSTRSLVKSPRRPPSRSAPDLSTTTSTQTKTKNQSLETVMPTVASKRATAPR